MQAVAGLNEYAEQDTQEPGSWVRRHRLMLAAVALSLLVHALLLFIQRTQDTQSGLRQEWAGDQPLAVTLAPPPSAQVAPPAPATPEAPPPTPRRPVPPKPSTPPPVIATPGPEPTVPMPAPQPPTTPPTEVPPPPVDMLAQLNAARQRRREAAGPAPTPDPGPTEEQRALGNAMRNLRSLTPGQDEAGTNGVFSINQVGYRSAEFTFRGWNTNFRRNWNEIVTVERGNNPDIRIAIVRKMIEIIRRYESRDFIWESRRLGRNVSLSARPEDQSGLEEFLLREFFPEYRTP